MNGKPVTGRHTCTHALDLCLVFQDIDKFGNEITQLARPLPVEYLIIDVSVRHLPTGGQDGGGWPRKGGGLNTCSSACTGQASRGVLSH